MTISYEKSDGDRNSANNRSGGNNLLTAAPMLKFWPMRAICAKCRQIGLAVCFCGFAVWALMGPVGNAQLPSPHAVHAIVEKVASPTGPGSPYLSIPDQTTGVLRSAVWPN